MRILISIKPHTGDTGLTEDTEVSMNMVYMQAIKMTGKILIVTLFPFREIEYK